LRASLGKPNGADMPANWFYQFRKVCHVLALCVPMLLAFTAFVVPIACTLAWYHGTAPTTNENFQPAIICGLVAGLFVAVFHVKRETTLVPFKNRQDFLTACKVVLKDLGYEIVEKPGDHLVSWPSFRGILLGGRIDIQPLENEGRINGPKVFVEILRSRLRLHSHITGVEQTLRDSRTLRMGDRRLKRIQISLRSTPEQWNDVGRSVVQKLVDEGAEVFCEIHLMAQSDEGIRASFIDGSIRTWLQQEHIAAEIHKDHSSWDDRYCPGSSLSASPNSSAD
jgi:hypothetical protein